MDLRVGKNYQLIKKIGSGAFGEIYEGKHVTTKQQVAIKLVRPLHFYSNRSLSSVNFLNSSMK